jgi:hypothetical protein
VVEVTSDTRLDRLGLRPGVRPLPGFWAQSFFYSVQEWRERNPILQRSGILDVGLPVVAGL